MRDFTTWLKERFRPSKSNFDDGVIEEINEALGDQTIRHYWIKSLEDEIWQLNVKIDRVMEAEQDTEWKKLSMRRNAIIFVMNKILDAKHLIESERADQERQNRTFEKYQGAAAPLDLRQS